MTAQGSAPEPSAPRGARTRPAPEAGKGGVRAWLGRQWVFVRFQLLEFSGLARRGLRSLRVRGLGPTWQLTRLRLFPPARVPYPLELYAQRPIPADLAVPCAPAPVASVIVPVHNQLGFTLRCLQSLGLSGDATPFEVLLVDDASTDESARVLPAVRGLRYLRNARNLGFIGSCNAAAEQARGDVLVFLNNDTIVQPGWLDALLRTFVDHPGTGLAGSKLVYPDGRLQEAGGIVRADGEAANYGRGEDPVDPRYNFARRADYCSGAALALPRALFARLGGFDAHFHPAYFEDTDLAMRVHAAGLEVRYQPASVVVHFEGATSGTDTRRGVKAHQTSNQTKFRARWEATLAGHAQPDPVDALGQAADLAARHRYRRRVLVIDSYTPTPDRDSGSLRMVEILGLLERAGCNVVFFSQNLAHDDRYTEDLQRRGIEVWWHPWIRSASSWLQEQGPTLDAIIVSRHYVLSPLLETLRVLAPRAKLVFDTVDLHFLREEREAAQAADDEAWKASQRTRELELGLIRAVDSTWVVSDVERRLLHDLAPGADVRIVSNVHAVRDDPPGIAGRRDLVFVGSYRHPPNVDAVRWMAREILPLVRARLPDIELLVVGADAPAQVLALAAVPGVRLLGHVPELEPLLDQCLASVAPLRFGAGIKGKVNQSLARGLPVVATSCAVEGMFLQDGEDVLVADAPDAFADAVVRLAGDPALWLRLQGAGLENTRRHFSRDGARATLLSWLDELGGD